MSWEKMVGKGEMSEEGGVERDEWRGLELGLEGMKGKEIKKLKVEKGK